MTRYALSRFLMLRDRTTLGRQVALVMAGLCLALVIAVASTAAFVARQQATAQVEAAMVTVANNMAERLDARMFERFREIRNIADLAPLKPAWEGEAGAARAVLEQLQSTLPEYAWIGYALPDGTVKAATGGLLEGVSVAERPWFIGGLTGATVKDVHDAKLLAELLGPDASGEPFRFVDVAVPVLGQDGAALGVLGAHMSWTWAAAVRDTVLDSIDPALQTDIWVLASDGTTLLGGERGQQVLSQQMLAAVQAGGEVNFVDEVAGDMVGAVATSGYGDYPGLGWIVLARRPLDLALAPANQMTLTIALIGLLFATTGIVGTALLSDRLTRPLRELAESIDSIGRDPGATMIARDHSSRDVAQLSVSVRSLLRRLGTAETAQESAAHEAAYSRQMLAEKTQRLGEDINALQILADTDPLTGLLNRRAFKVFGTDAMNYYRRHMRNLGVLVIDIDFFKRVNDTFGHAVGDEVIRAVGQIISDEARSIDKVARFGGEEFVLLLRETEKEGPPALAERIRARIAGALVDHADHTIHVTVSIGAAMACPTDRDIEDVIERADRALYKAKSNGRNCVVIADTDDLNAVSRAA